MHLNNELKHYGILGMHWGVRRYQPYPKGKKGIFTGKVHSVGSEYGKAVKKADKLNTKAEKGLRVADRKRARYLKKDARASYTEFGRSGERKARKAAHKAERKAIKARAKARRWANAMSKNFDDISPARLNPEDVKRGEAFIYKYGTHKVSSLADYR